ncbi:MAG: GlxA family transcriptional regulator [Halocynthiibacter sp.]
MQTGSIEVLEKRRFLPKGPTSFQIDQKVETKEFYFVLLPNLTLMALSAAIEPLRIANQLSQKELYRWYKLAPDMGSVTCSNAMEILPDGALRDLPKSATAFVCSGGEPLQNQDARVTQWVRKQRALGVRLGGLCTGAFTLAKAGVLNGQNFTLHWENQAAFSEEFPDLTPSMNLIETTPSVLTTAGGSSSTDLMLNLIEEDYGAEFALVVADMCLHSRSHQREITQKSPVSVSLGSRNPKLISAVQLMQANLEEPLDLDVVSEHAHVSRRQLERMFKGLLGMSPGRYYCQLRLERAYALLSETNMKVSEVVAATGFCNTTHFSRLFRQKYGAPPNTFRKSWA